MSAPEVQFDRVPLLSPGDASHLGRLAALGFALPTDEVVRMPAQPVREEDLSTPIFQRQVQRLKDAAHGIGRIPGANFGGVAMSQLTLDPELEAPFNLAVVAHSPNLAGDSDLVTKFHGETKMEFRVLANLAFTLGPESVDTIGGCFSQANICTITTQATTLHKISALSLGDGMVEAGFIDGFAAFSYQHEKGHNSAMLAGDAPGTRRIIVERAPKSKSPISLEEYRRRRKPEEFEDWPQQVSDRGWHQIFSEPGYDLFPTEQLQEAFEEGRQAQLEIMAE